MRLDPILVYSFIWFGLWVVKKGIYERTVPVIYINGQTHSSAGTVVCIYHSKTEKWLLLSPAEAIHWF
jgi:hypothetical protein